MLFIGALLLIAAVAVAVAAVGGGGGAVSFEVLNNTIEATGAEAFLVGTAAGAAALAGLWLMRAGSRVAYSRRRELSKLRRTRREASTQEQDEPASEHPTEHPNEPAETRS